jgi:hypothetical protein
MIALCSILFVTCLHAQGPTLTGFYVNNNGDTIRGSFPALKQTGKNPKEIDFLPSAKTGLVKLTPSGCYRVVVENFEEYVSYNGKRLINPIEESEVLGNKDRWTFTNEYDTLHTFLRLIRKFNDFEVYVQQDNVRRNFFYKQGRDSTRELIFKKFFSQDRISEVQEYKQQLRTLLASTVDPQRLSSLLNDLPYRENEIVDLFYYAEQKGALKRRPKNKNAGLVVSAGVSVNSFAVDADESVFKPVSAYKSSLSPLFAVGYIAPLSRKNSRHFVYPNMNIYKYKNTGEVSNGDIIRRTTYQTSLAIGVGINGGTNVVNTEPCKVFVSGGAKFMFLQNNKKIDEIIIVSSNYTNDIFTERLPGMAYVFNLSTGILLSNKLMAAAVYNFPVNVGNFKFLSAKASSIQLSVGYKLN